MNKCILIAEVKEEVDLSEEKTKTLDLLNHEILKME